MSKKGKTLSISTIEGSLTHLGKTQQLSKFGAYLCDDPVLQIDAESGATITLPPTLIPSELVLNKGITGKGSKVFYVLRKELTQTKGKQASEDAGKYVGEALMILGFQGENKLTTSTGLLDAYRQSERKTGRKMTIILLIGIIFGLAMSLPAPPVGILFLALVVFLLIRVRLAVRRELRRIPDSEEAERQIQEISAGYSSP